MRQGERMSGNKTIEEIPEYIKHFREQRDFYYNKQNEAERTLDTTLITIVTIMLTVSGTIVGSVSKQFVCIPLIVLSWISFVITMILIVINMKIQSSRYDDIINECKRIDDIYKKTEELADYNYPGNSTIPIINYTVITLTIVGSLLLTIFFCINL